MVSNDSRDGTHFAIVNSDSTDLVTLVDTRVHTNPGLESTENVTVIVTFSVDENDIAVTVTKKVYALTPLVGVFTKDQQINLRSSTVMRVE